MTPSAVVDRIRATPSTTASLRAERKRISREIAALERSAVLDLAHKLIASRIPRFVAYELILHHAPAMDAITEAEVTRLGEGMRGWGDVDCFGCIVAGPAWRAGRIRDRLIHSWARSEDWCWRRAALVATVPLNSRAQGGPGDTDRTLAACCLLLADRHDLVVKAMSWALRELSKRDATAVRHFLEVHGDQLAPRVVREVNNKLDTGLKNPRATGKS